MRIAVSSGRRAGYRCRPGRILNSALALLFLFSVYEDMRGRIVFDPVFDRKAFVGDWVPVCSGALAGAMAVLATVRDSRWVPRAASVACAGTFVATVAYRLLPVNMATSESSGTELIGLLVLLAVAVRRCTPRWAPVVVVALAVSVFSVPVLRDSDPGDFSDKTVLELALAFVCGLVLRLYDVQQERTGQLVRQEERLALARDLHDTVAHQVTAIVVQLQAVRHVTGRGTPDPRMLNEMLEAVEHAGGEALTSMRRLVGSMRGDETPRHPESLGEVLTRIVDEARTPGLPIRLDLGQGLPQDVPTEVTGGLGRVLQEGLTNSRRHARGARTVDVSARVAARYVELVVEDDGQGSASGGRGSLGRLGGGFGIMGMRERVELLGGTFEAGHRPEGGWRVHASVPLHPGEAARNARARGRHAVRSGSRPREGRTA
ncbi:MULTISPECIES: sensor histidine kinase [Streptomyces]|uniref:sensor histidine kinase n=2 Tax=Streptomyces scabiei TaxID=1930 RepID=UPI000AC383AC|nr:MULTISPECIES: histidine kinase [Streptomyces]MBP5880876.1 sensor histidine kinase [Streptomyces sp. LBUM 1487]MBP5896631.1 sensor histidine kinase [Streptomyces sp. LBUM 1488]MDX3674061.1 histidine kinase [Streptomyces scabiei]QTU59639.1 sensor histidine kinase [Streptomyces sp. LBUM 1475]